LSFNAEQNYSAKSDEHLMALISRGSEKAFNELYTRYYQKLYIFIFHKMNRNGPRAKDLLQDLFLKLIENSESFDRSKNFKVWIYTIARNMCKNEYRSKKVRDSYKERYLLNHSQTLTTSKIGPETMDLKRFEKMLRNELSRLDENIAIPFYCVMNRIWR